jgi:hypothetical protein
LQITINLDILTLSFKKWDLMSISLSTALFNMTKNTLSEKDDALFKKGEFIALSTIVAGVALTILGLACAPGSLALLFVSLPLVYIGFNGLKVLNNFKAVVQQPEKVKNYWGAGKVNTNKLKEALSQGTFYFRWAIDPIVEKMVDPKQRKK